mmetsp:Transcript_3543/g.6839  ORF Transcript_3543/g.6839 Transcript_3543/m.6839 type:complete len:261 (+) Transcript_3543:583-1365(+)
MQRSDQTFLEASGASAQTFTLHAAFVAHTPLLLKSSQRSSPTTSGTDPLLEPQEDMFIIAFTTSTTRSGTFIRTTSAKSFSSLELDFAAPRDELALDAATRSASSSEFHIISSSSMPRSNDGPTWSWPLPAQRLAVTSTASLRGRHEALHASTALSYRSSAVSTTLPPPPPSAPSCAAFDRLLSPFISSSSIPSTAAVAAAALFCSLMAFCLLAILLALSCRPLTSFSTSRSILASSISARISFSDAIIRAARALATSGR